MSDPHPNHAPKPRSGQRHTRFDRRHLVLLLAALACIGGLVLFVAEMDLDLDSGLTPQNPTPQNSSPQSAPPPAK
jgi:hypothetical protein